MVPLRSIKSLYRLALAEGEGIGTAYEYFVKRMVLRRWLAACGGAPRILIAGLPEKYGSSLDFLLIAQELGAAEIVVVDEQEGALDKNRRSLVAAQEKGELMGIKPQYVRVSDLSRLGDMKGVFDLCLCSEVLQRLDPVRRQRYVTDLKNKTMWLALFAPNDDNPNHTKVSGLSGIRLTGLQTLLDKAGVPASVGYIDMPPFLPGITRSEEQRQNATNGRLESVVMSGLAYYARLETSFPSNWRQRHAHIVYALSSASHLSRQDKYSSTYGQS